MQRKQQFLYNVIRSTQAGEEHIQFYTFFLRDKILRLKVLLDRLRILEWCMMVQPSPPSSSPQDGRLESGPYGKKLSMLPLVALIFYEVSGGPFGVEDSVKAGGPLLAILGFLIFPFLWCIPEALITAELSTAFPENGGYVVWISAAFGPFWGFLEGWWKWLSGVIDNALYPVLFLDYLKRALPVFSEGPARIVALVLLTCGLTYLNYRGLTIVGRTAIALTIFSLLPFFVLAILAVPLLKPGRWSVIDVTNINWRSYLNTLFWNLNYWDSVSTLAGEVENPHETFPKALLSAVLLVLFAYIVPLLAGTGALPLNQSAWEAGYFADVAMAIGGSVLKWWIEIAAALSNMGLFEAEMSSDSYQLLGMGELGMLPQVFAHRSIYGTPVLGILCSALGVVLLSSMTFQEIVEFLNFLYCFGMLLEFAAFIWLRFKQPELSRPYTIPLNTLGITLMCVPPSTFLILIMSIASAKTILFSVMASLLGLLAYPVIEYIKVKKWVKFAVSQSLPCLPPEVPDVVLDKNEQSEVEIGLLSDWKDDGKELPHVIKPLGIGSPNVVCL